MKLWSYVPINSKYTPLTLIDILFSFLAVKQGDNEELIDYISSFKSEQSVQLGIMWTKFFDGFTENSQEYKNIYITYTAAQSALKEDVVGRFMAILFLRNAKQSCFGEMLVEYRKAFANKEDIYPKTIPDMVDVVRKIPEKKRKQNPKPPGKEKE